MNLPDLIHSLTIAGIKMKLGPDGAIDVFGQIERLTDEHRQGVRENKSQIQQLLGCFTESEEEAEREAIIWADTDEAKLQAIKIGADFIPMAAADHHTWLWNKIGQQESIEDLEAFAQRFENDLTKFEVYRPIADDIRELIANRRVLLYASKEASESDDANRHDSL